MIGVGRRTSLGRPKVFAWSRGARPGATSLLDAQRPALIHLTLQALLRCIRLFSSDHLDETKPTALAAVGVAHDIALLDLAILLEQASDLVLSETRVNAGDEEVRSGVRCVSTAAVGGWTTIAQVRRGALFARFTLAAYRSSRPFTGSSRTLTSPSRSPTGERERSRGGG